MRWNWKFVKLHQGNFKINSFFLQTRFDSDEGFCQFSRKLEKNKMKLKIWETATGQLKIVVVFIPSNQVWFWWFCKCFNYKYQEIVVFHIYCCKCNISAATILCQIAAGHETNRLEELPNIGRSSNLAIMRFPTISCQQKYHPELFLDIKIVFYSYRIILPLQVGRASKYWKLENSLKIMQFYYCTL